MKFFNRFSMKSKILLLSIGSAVVCAFVLISIVSSMAERALGQQIVSNLTALVVSKSEEVDFTMRKLKSDVATLSNSKFVQDALVSYESVAYGTGLDLEQDSNLSNSSYFKTIESKYAESFQDYLSSMPLTSFALSMNNGLVISESGEKTLLGRNLKNGFLKDTELSKCFESAKAEGWYMTKIVTIENQSDFYVCQSVNSKYERDGYQKNAQMGVLIARLDWQILAKLAEFKSGLGETGQLYLVSDGVLITPTREFQKTENLQKILDKKMRFEHHSPESGYGAATGFKGEQILFISRKLEISPNNGWVMVGEISRDEALEGVRDLKLWSYAILLLGALVVSAISWFLSNSISNRFSKAGADVAASSNVVGKAAIEFSSIASRVASSTQHQSAALEETSSAMEEITSMVQRTLDLSRSSSTKASTCADKAIEGSEKMESLVRAVDSLGHEAEASFENVRQSSDNALNEVLQAFKSIEEKAKVINEIAFQTKLLSFNASVEAARAGEHGKGFAVVAIEVGQLANSVNNSAQEIESFLTSNSIRIGELIKESSQTIERSMSESTAKVQDSKRSANVGFQFFKELTELVQEIQAENATVATAADEQSKGIVEVNKAIAEIAKDNSTNAALVLNLESLTVDLKTSTTSLGEAADEVHEIVYGSSSGRSQQAPVEPGVESELQDDERSAA